MNPTAMTSTSSALPRSLAAGPTAPTRRHGNSELEVVWRRLETPLGPLLLVGSQDGALHQIGLPKGKLSLTPEDSWRQDASALGEAVDQLEQYFAGTRREFSVRLEPQGTEFQKKVWAALRQIPYGQTISYAELATRVGNPKASRAVGAANGRNPLPIVVPCHRVIGADGSLVGFGGGLDAKRALLRIEGVAVREQASLLSD
jgi:methylated-DNA-[protein]-cysteine S-methyltransferase